eukprot:10931036-Heterocapsa_arctica.AAC.1
MVSCTRDVADATRMRARTRRTVPRPTLAGAPRIFVQASLHGCLEVRRRAEADIRLCAEEHRVARRWAT